MNETLVMNGWPKRWIMFIALGGSSVETRDEDDRIAHKESVYSPIPLL